MNIGSGVFGTIIGAAVTYLFQFTKEKKEKKRIKEAVELEVEINFKELTKFKEKIHREPPDFAEAVIDDEIIDILIPDFNPIFLNIGKKKPDWLVQIWNKYTAEIALAVDIEIFKKIYLFYQNLPKISEAYERVTRVQGDSDKDKKKRNDLYLKLIGYIKQTEKNFEQIKNS
jgi:hypothetical protein